MTTQPEQILENNLIKQLQTLGYSRVKITNEADLLKNFKAQLEKHNKIKFSEGEFSKILNHLNKGNIFDRAKTLRDRMQFVNDKGEHTYIEFLNLDDWCMNEYQVTNQVTMEGSYKNRYDVTLLVNGLPLVQIELKKRGLELKEAFNQTNRYQRHSFNAGYGLYQYIQFFVISNGVNTKYYANNPVKALEFKQTFFWSDAENKTIRNLEQFTFSFLDTCHMSKMISKYIVLNETQKILMILRPYQYFAVEAIIDRVKNSNKNGYIWHTTGSGKTLTSFKASQILKNLPEVHKVVFVVDRKDLDYQTQKEFDAFAKGSVDATDNTKKLVEQLNDTTKLIVTTIQKLNNAIYKKRYLSKTEHLKDKRIVFIFDECHRSQFGETHNRIKSFFNQSQMFGFTGTPIFADNAVKNEHGKRTTKELFEESLHKYVITDAIRDENVLKFSIEYIGRYKQKEDSKTNIDIKVEEIDTKEAIEAPDRLNKITDYIIANHNRKTHSKEFTAMFCVSSIDVLIKYYELFKQKKEDGKHNLKIATIFSYTANEEDRDASGYIPEPDLAIAAEPESKYGTKSKDINSPKFKHSREKLDEFIDDYNKMFNTNYSTKDSQLFYNYYKDIAKKVKNRNIDVLIVVNMFLTGFDSKSLNTMYVDKNLRYHGLIQAFSRTNRILGEQKSQGNIVCFRNLKKATDEAIALFSNKNAKELIIMEPYEDYLNNFNRAYDTLLKITPEISSVDDLKDEEEELAFIKAFRDLMRIRNILNTFSDFDFEDIDMDEQEFEDYKSKYLDLYEKVKLNTDKETVSILDDIDFELELIHRDEVNVAYILALLANLKDTDNSGHEKQKKEIIDLISGEAKLRSKRLLIEKFIEENLPKIVDTDNISDEFDKFWGAEQKKAFAELCKEENLYPDKLQEVISEYLFTDRTPLRDDVVHTFQDKPKIKERKKLAERVIQKIQDFVETFVNGVAT